MRNWLLALLIGLGICLGVSGTSQAQDEARIAGVLFRSTWCPPCHILEPRLNAAKRDYQGRIHFVRFDFSFRDEETLRDQARAEGLVGVFNHYQNQLGVLVLMDRDSGQVLEVITARYSAEDIEDAFERALAWQG
ncbi:TlpA family protein disulfide reductase [Woodsholea maritima]|uniref:TlpA family protein disulfide reductase n=1 Tax=Woodsholea maritima TaxID=240237 RepID=UPI00036DAE66|nr:thioredoxin domain-containing protein [Woodsholea maritima]